MRGLVIGRPGFAARSRGVRDPLFRWEPKHWREAIPLTVLLAGVTIGGGAAAWGLQNSDVFFLYYTQQILEQHGLGFLQVAAASFLASLALTGLVALLGTCCLGQPFIYGALLLRGVAAGCLTAGMYGQMGMRGMLANLVLLLLPTLLLFWLLLRVAKSALSASRALFATQCLQRQCAAPPAVKIQRLGRLFLQAGVGLLFVAVLEALLALVFSPVFL